MTSLDPTRRVTAPCRRPAILPASSARPWIPVARAFVGRWRTRSVRPGAAAPPAYRLPGVVRTPMARLPHPACGTRVTDCGRSR
jgi:hypothetical protein